MSTNKELANYRLSQAGECLNDAKMAFENGSFKNSANRSYYCVFHCMRSLLALEQVDFKKHSAVISHFRKNYIKTEIFETKLSDILDLLFDARAASDYDDFYVISKEETENQITNAEYFLEQVKTHLEKQA